MQGPEFSVPALQVFWGDSKVPAARFASYVSHVLAGVFELYPYKNCIMSSGDETFA